MPTWDEVVEQHSDRVFRLAYRLTGNRPDAEDLTQEVFVRVFRSLDTYTPGTFEGWLHRITTNLFLDGARRKQRIRFDPLSDERAARLTSPAPAPELAVADRTFDDDIETALATLPPDFRAAVVLCDVEGLSYEEIAEIMDAKLGTVRSRIHRGRTMLRKALAHREPAAGRSRYSGPVAPHPPRGGGVMSHLGSRVSALLDGRLAPEEEERCWSHVHACHACRDLVEQEGWVKTQLAQLSFGPASPPTTSSRSWWAAARRCSPAPATAWSPRSSRRRATARAAASSPSAAAQRAPASWACSPSAWPVPRASTPGRRSPT